MKILQVQQFRQFMIYSVPPVPGNAYNTWEVAVAPNTFRVLIDPTDYNGDDMTSWLQSINIGDIYTLENLKMLVISHIIELLV